MAEGELKMIYVTGDTHGNQYKWIEQIDTVLNAEDTILVCGDFGIGFWNGRYWSEEMFFDYLSEQKYTILFVDGNHENFEKLNSYPEDMWSGGRVHKSRNNVIHLIRGETYCIEDNLFFVMGVGTLSINLLAQKEFLGGRKKCHQRKNTTMLERI